MTWKNIHKKFGFKIEHAGKERTIVSQRMTRTGLEFSGYFNRKQIKASILWGKEEFDYLKSFEKHDRNIKLENIFKLYPPVIILSRTFLPNKTLLNLAKKYDVTIMSTEMSSSDLNTQINLFLAENLSKVEVIHGNLLQIYGKGVLLIAESGMGKSETTVELLKHGHLFVADDAVDCRKVFGKLIGWPSAISKGFMEVRGLGIINVARLFGIEKIVQSTNIDLVIELVEYNPNVHVYERLGSKLNYKEINNVQLPYYLVPVSVGKKLSDLIEVIVSNFKLIESGYNSFDEFIKNSHEVLNDK